MRGLRCVGVFFICGIFSQGISTFTKENIQESLDLQVRKKRLIDKSQFGDRPIRIGLVPYIVNIHRNGKANCAGSILAPNIIITAAHCVHDDAWYIILSGSSHEKHGVPHNVTRKIIHPEYHRDRFPNDLALLIINPPIDLIHSPNRKIALYIGEVDEDTIGTISGWGSNCMTLNETRYPDKLRSITMPVMSLESCKETLKNVLEITDRNICTFDRSFRKKCAIGDSGDPLVIAYQLVGVYSGGGSSGVPVGPDVFIHLSHPAYRNWIFLFAPPNPRHPHVGRSRI